jgi:zinc protease
MARAKKLPKPRLNVDRFSLPNGLRVVLNPDPSASTVGIAVAYDVGFRSEPEGRTGFAHLFEHLMFQGSASLEKGQADRLIEGNGGMMNGSTHPDFTNYISQLPSNALELGLFLEADRMRAPRLTEENLRNQIDVVKEEIRVNVMNRPYGGFPWVELPQVMFDGFNNAHDGYGSFVDLESATLDDASDFFDRYYTPANAVLSVAGDLDADDARAHIERHFGSIRDGAAPPPAMLSEPVRADQRRRAKEDALAPLPALAVGYRVPDPINAVDAYAAAIVAAEVLAGGEPSRLYQRLVKRDRTATYVFGMVGTFGDPLEMRDPTMLQLVAYLPPDTPSDDVLRSMSEEIARAADKVEAGEVDRVVTGLVSDYFRQLDNPLERAITLSILEQQRDQPEWVNDYPAVLGAVTPRRVAETIATWLAGSGSAVLEIIPGAHG